jgi:hypothetical protein
MGQFWLGILIIAIAAALGWWGKEIASEGWRNWRHPDPPQETATTAPNTSKAEPSLPEPIVRSYLEHPIITEGNQPSINKKNPDAILRNDGPVIALSVKVDLWVLYFQREQVTNAGSLGKSPHGHLFAVDELKPSQELRQSVVGGSGSSLAAYIMDIEFNRKGDLKAFKRRDIFFVEKGVIYREEEFERRQEYKSLLAAIERFMTEKKGLPKTTFRGTDENAWIADPDPRHAVTLNEDGSASLSLRFTDIQQLKSHYQTTKRPVLLITPVRFKDSNTYLKAKYGRDKGTVNYKLEVTNQGDEIAIVQQDINSTETVSIAPGEKKYLNQEVFLARATPGPSNKASIQESTEINFETNPLLTKTVLYYRAKGDIQTQYRSTVTYEIKNRYLNLISEEYR